VKEYSSKLLDKALDAIEAAEARDGFDKRISGDYGVDTGISETIVADMINHARDFLLDARKYIEKQEQNEE